MAGYDRAFANIIAGVNFSYTDGSFENKSASAHDSDISIYSFNGYATYNHCPGFFAGILGGCGYADNDIRERYNNLWTRDDYHTSSWYGDGRVGYNLTPLPGLTISPSAGLVYADSRSSAHDSVVEAVGTVRRVGKMKYNSAMIPFDVTVGYTIDFGDCSRLNLDANVGYAYNFDADGPGGIITQQGLVIGGNPAGTFRVKSRDIGHHTLNLGAGAKYSIGRFDVGMKYEYYRKADYEAHRVSGTVGVAF